MHELIVSFSPGMGAIRRTTVARRRASARCRSKRSSASRSRTWTSSFWALRCCVHLLLLEPAAALLQKWGDFSSSRGWLSANASDPWARGPALLGTDADKDGGRGGALLEDPRVFMGGLSDESGAAASLAMASKQLGLPVQSEVDQLEEYVHETLWAGAAGERKRFLQGKDYSVRLSWGGKQQS